MNNIHCSLFRPTVLCASRNVFSNICIKHSNVSNEMEINRIELHLRCIAFQIYYVITLVDENYDRNCIDCLLWKAINVDVKIILG